MVSTIRLVVVQSMEYYNLLFDLSETAMGRTIRAQSNGDSEYVKAIYKYVIVSI